MLDTKLPISWAFILLWQLLFLKCWKSTELTFFSFEIKSNYSLTKLSSLTDYIPCIFIDLFRVSQCIIEQNENFEDTIRCRVVLHLLEMRSQYYNIDEHFRGRKYHMAGRHGTYISSLFYVERWKQIFFFLLFSNLQYTNKFRNVQWMPI